MTPLEDGAFFETKEDAITALLVAGFRPDGDDWYGPARESNGLFIQERASLGNDPRDAPDDPVCVSIWEEMVDPDELTDEEFTKALDNADWSR